MTSESKEPCLTFYPDSDMPWFVRMIRYENALYPVFEVNREDYPDPAPDEFARAVLKVLEDNGMMEEFIEERAQELLKNRTKPTNLLSLF